MFAVARSAFAALLCVLLAGLTVATASEIQRFERGEFAFEFGPAAEWVETATVADAWPEDAPGARDAALRHWLLDIQVNRRGVRARYFDHALEPVTEARVGDASRIELSFNPAYQRLVLHRVEVRRGGEWSSRFNPDGVTLARREGEFESGMATGMVSALVLVADVRAGDVLRIAYSIEGENPILAGLTHESFNQAWFDPVLDLRVRVETPVAAPAVRLLDGAEAPAVNRHPEGSSLRWRGERLAAIPPEEDVPPWAGQIPVMEVSEGADWARVQAWAATLYPAAELPEELERRVAEWRQLPSAEARAVAALQAVQDEVRYFSVLLGDSSHRPTPPMETWARRYGDCKDKAWLLATLLARLDLQAQPALVSTGSQRGVRRGLPAASQFDHVIVQAEVDGRTFWLDPTLSHQRGPLAQRQSYDFGAALAIAGAEAGLTDMATAREVVSRRHIEHRYRPSEDGREVEFSVVTRLSGAYAHQLRRYLDEAGAAAAALEFSGYYGRLHGELEPIEPLRSEDGEDGSLATFERYRLKAPWSAQSGSARVFELAADALYPMVAASNNRVRRAPLLRAHPVEIEQTLLVEIPEGWTAQGAPTPLKAGDASFEYSRGVESTRSSVRVAHRFSSRADEVASADASAHLAARRTASQAISSNLQLIQPGATARSDRARRLQNLLRESPDAARRP